jgi:hypothetical protein
MSQPQYRLSIPLIAITPAPLAAFILADAARHFQMRAEPLVFSLILSADGFAFSWIRHADAMPCHTPLAAIDATLNTPLAIIIAPLSRQTATTHYD